MSDEIFCHAMDQFNVVSMVGKLIATTYLLVFKYFFQTLFVTGLTSTTRSLRIGICELMNSGKILLKKLLELFPLLEPYLDFLVPSLR